MTSEPTVPILPYSYLVGQDALRMCLELSYIEPGIGGLLITGERGTAKSTAVRAFSRMVFGRLPVTLPINATDDRVLGGWRIDALMAGETREQTGLLEAANETGLLYVDEVNLLDDHLVNLILDVASTGVLNVQREGLDRPEIPVRFSLVGTMNPEEGGLRPQLLDRFGLLVPVTTETSPVTRRRVVETVLRFQEEKSRPDSPWLEQAGEFDRQRRRELERARWLARAREIPGHIIQLSATIAAEFGVAGHRGDIVTALAARAHAALRRRDKAIVADVRAVAPYALAHRLPEAAFGEAVEWTEDHQKRLDEITAG
ncbi:AAA family ATPase [Actinomadura sp. NEAU-AAG7]|uniref:AAA family ATPase n=1 Tax=Actinomadura sp. NEAU-AAG7 TaxID=2839640 RepID=UPI001BE461B9|nr:AAA family ATPase [Actinomadura sp. NEAU-AAG7]MBT2207892.1 AAA family ATPase [Actinomadura sp. NEAU-AAG7]